MIGKLFKTAFASMAMSFTVFATQGEGRKPQTCGGPVYSPKEVSRRARITRRPDLSVLTQVAAENDLHGKAIVEAVLCRSGRVTDIRVVGTLPSNLNEFVVAAVSTVGFAPAELNFHTVSQRTRFDFRINGNGLAELSPELSARLVEELDVIGYRRLGKEEILNWIHTRPGDDYSPDQIQSDFNAIMATGNFDMLYSRVSTEDGVRGGVVVKFLVVENPLISEVKFVGLPETDRAAIISALVSENINLARGVVFDITRIKFAMAVMKRALESRGWKKVDVELDLERLTASNVALTFTIRSQ